MPLFPLSPSSSTIITALVGCVCTGFIVLESRPESDDDIDINICPWDILAVEQKLQWEEITSPSLDSSGESLQVEVGDDSDNNDDYNNNDDRRVKWLNAG